MKKSSKTIKVKGKKLHSIIQHAMGCMFLSEIEPLIFVFKESRKLNIHTCFVRYPLDIAFLDEKKTIIEVKKNVKPWCCFNSKTCPHFMIETKAGRFDFKLNDKVTFL